MSDFLEKRSFQFKYNDKVFIVELFTVKLCVISDNVFYLNGFLNVWDNCLCLSPNDFMGNYLSKKSLAKYCENDSVIIRISDYKMLLRVFECVKKLCLSKIIIEFNTSLNKSEIINICNVHVFFKKITLMKMCHFIKNNFIEDCHVISIYPEKVTVNEWSVLFKMMTGIDNRLLSKSMNVSEKTISGQKCSLVKKMNISNINRGSQLQILYLFSSIHRHRNNGMIINNFY